MCEMLHSVLPFPLGGQGPVFKVYKNTFILTSSADPWFAAAKAFGNRKDP
jgi:hypothetical protein